MAKKKQSARAAPPSEPLLAESEDIEDEFAAGATRIALEPGAAGSDEELDDQAVYDLDDDDDDDEDEDEDDEDADEAALEEALARGGNDAALAKAARYLEAKLKLARGEHDDDDDDDDAQQGAGASGLRDKLWGANKRSYYQDGADEGQSDDDALAEEEEEVRRLQAEQAAALGDVDYGLGDAGGGGAAAAGEQPLGALVDGAPGVAVEAVAKDLGALTAEERSAVVLADAPELVGLLDELTACLAEARGVVGPLLREVSAGGLATASGLSYLEAKHLLLLQHCCCIVAYLMLKAEGRPVADHPVIGRLVQLRSYMDKIRPIDKQLAYQIDKLLRATALAQAAPGGAEQQQQQGGGAAAAAAAAGGDDDALAFRPNPGQLLPKAPLLGDGGAAAAAAGVYRPPKLNPVAMEEDRAASAKELRRLRQAQRRAQRSSVLTDVARDLAGAPEEVTAELPGMDSAAAVAARHRLEARAAAEEELMLRVPLSKVEAKRLKAQRRAGLSGAGLTDFADDVADLVAATTAGSDAGLGGLYGRSRLSQQYGADLAAAPPKARSGDDDLLPRQPLHERRAVFDAVAAKRAAADDEAGGGKRRRPAGEEDELYAATKAARRAAKAAKAAAHDAPQLAPPLPEPSATGARKISYEIEKNRGLTPHRRKDLKNPRKKHRVKFAQAVVRRKGQVQGVQAAPGAPRGYGGEATGIKSRVSKSVRFGS